MNRRLTNHDSQFTPKKPEWLRVKEPLENGNYRQIRDLIESKRLNTVCKEAGCPNIYECFNRRTATFMILGNVCTRNCTFCKVSGGETKAVDPDEPRKVAEAALEMGLNYAVITSVTRDDLIDGGAAHFAETIRCLRESSREIGIEVLIPDFGGDAGARRRVAEARPTVLNHNIETVPRLYPEVRPQADYERSLKLLMRAKKMFPQGKTKSGLMVGLGENRKEVNGVIDDLRSVGCDILTIGQYLAPSKIHHPVIRYYTPEEFTALKEVAIKKGFLHVESAPLVRSSYHAERVSGAVSGKR